MTQDPRVELLLTQWEAGGGKASADDLCASAPDLRDEVARRIALLRRLAPFIQSDRGAAGPEHANRPTLPNYQIVDWLGEGGMGVVWRAVQLSAKREVALKVIHAGTFATTRARQRFEREVALTARLEHPNITRLYDSGEHEGISFYAMELIVGRPLDVHARQENLSRRDVLVLMAAVCRAVQYAHQRGVIHRDLKPSNILVDRLGQPHVLDFGLAKTLGEDSDPTKSVMTTAGDISGTVRT